MKADIIRKVVREVKVNPRLRRKLAAVAIVGLVFVVAIGGVAIWASVTAVQYVVTSVGTELKDTQFQPLSCWEKAQDLWR